MRTAAVAAPGELAVLNQIRREAGGGIACFDNLTLPEITALASQASLFVGNDSGIAHIAAAVQTPTVAIFGSSNVDHWRPWTDAPNEIVRDEAGGSILNVKVETVTEAIGRVIDETKKRRDLIPAAVQTLQQES